MDSGSTTHVFKRPSYFINWDRNFNISNCIIKLASGKVTNLVKGRGTVELRLLNNHNQSTVIRLINALYMPSLNHEGIISSKQCIRQQKAEFSLKDVGSYMFIEGQLIPLKDSEKLHYVNSVNVRLHTSNKSMDAWHSLLGHADKKAVALTEGVVHGMHITGKKKSTQCIVCIRGKRVIRLSNS